MSVQLSASSELREINDAFHSGDDADERCEVVVGSDHLIVHEDEECGHAVELRLRICLQR
jgi:hypothetical protein